MIPSSENKLHQKALEYAVDAFGLERRNQYALITGAEMPPMGDGEKAALRPLIAEAIAAYLDVIEINHIPPIPFEPQLLRPDGTISRVWWKDHRRVDLGDNT